MKHMILLALILLPATGFAGEDSNRSQEVVDTSLAVVVETASVSVVISKQF